ncbi:hypothetical protein DRE_02998 [Drechslerella stenobrocha 248]|uniref:Bacteriophage T5 Orf172 DNA-binding domain-containing protein n=1 Tax=Drechslerella stenobrocha 248 TaxID=1043628 RepID=W7I6H4_9PEZI|nr:hypothetical protein DRE_02998 [Drechslerella stenobrocha 248]
MPYVSSTPEVLAARLIGRSDSRNPATTCRGISISSGKPCRRSIAKGQQSSARQNGDSESANPAEEFFCFQHKDQAADVVVLCRSESQRLRRLQGRTSLDTLVEVVLGSDGEDGEGASAAVGPDQAEVIIRRETLLNNNEVMVVRKNTVVKKDAKIVKDAVRRKEGKKAVWEALHGQQQQQPSGGHWDASNMPLSAFPAPPSVPARPTGPAYPPNNQSMPPPPPPPPPPQPLTAPRPKQRPSLLAQLLCCIKEEDEVMPLSRPSQQPQMQNARPRPQHQHQQNTASYPPSNLKRYSQSMPQRPHGTYHPTTNANGSLHIKFQPQVHPFFPPNIHAHNGWDGEAAASSESDSESDQEEPVIVPEVQANPDGLPSHLSAKTAALITAEMNKPISQKDMPGYIYIFLLKDKSSAPPAAAPAPAPTAPKRNRKISYSKIDPISAVLYRAVEDDDNEEDEESCRPVSPSTSRKANPDKRVLLKIGRAQNVQRRLHQWSQQCGYNLHLLRYYPHIPLVDGGSVSERKSSTAQAQERKDSTVQERKDSAFEAANIPGQQVPFAHRVERLIHLELRDEYYNQPHTCSKCERVHKEWFAVPANREGVRRVDEVIKRWCRWADSVEGAVRRREQGQGSGLGHRRGESTSSTGSKDGVAANEKGERRATGGVRGVERPVWREGYQDKVTVVEERWDEEAQQQTRMERMGTFGFL